MNSEDALDALITELQWTSDLLDIIDEKYDEIKDALDELIDEVKQILEDLGQGAGLLDLLKGQANKLIAAGIGALAAKALAALGITITATGGAIIALLLVVITDASIANTRKNIKETLDILNSDVVRTESDNGGITISSGQAFVMGFGIGRTVVRNSSGATLGTNWSTAFLGMDATPSVLFISAIWHGMPVRLW